MLFRKNFNIQIQVYTIKHLQLETSKTCEKKNHFGDDYQQIFEFVHDQQTYLGSLLWKQSLLRLRSY